MSSLRSLDLARPNFTTLRGAQLRRPKQIFAKAAAGQVDSARDASDGSKKALKPRQQRSVSAKQPTKSSDPTSKAEIASQTRASSPEASTSGSTESVAPKEAPKTSGRNNNKQEQSDKQPTELIFRLSRRGEGWGEEIIPHLTVEQRPIDPPTSRSRKVVDETGTEPHLWAPSGLVSFLAECGVPLDSIENLITSVVAWRFTAAGRPLIDRRRLSRIERNVRMVASYLEMECGIPFGPKGIAAVFARVPEIMLCKPAANDRWDRRAVELAAYLHRNGHCNVPEEWESNPELGIWVKRQRVARAGGQLSDERLIILERMGFEFGDLAQVTDEWEHRFDQLIDWVLWHRENHQKFCWLGIDWGERGGITARELALWMALQKEFRRRQLLPVEALKRFEAINVVWDAEPIRADDADWMEWFGRLLYVVERQTIAMKRPPPAPASRQGRNKANTSSNDSDDDDEGSGESSNSGGGNGSAGSHDGRRRTPPADQQARARLARVVLDRREALESADLRVEPGLRVWLARQQALWRRRKLRQEQVLLLHMAGFVMDSYTPLQWQQGAHVAAEVVQGSHVKPNQQPGQNKEGGNGADTARTGHAAFQSSDEDTPPTTTAAAQPDEPEIPVKKKRGRKPSVRPPPPEPEPAIEEETLKQPVPFLGENACRRLAVRRWVQTQQALFAENRLSRAQLRYLTFLGITWILSDEVVLMNEDDWLVYLEGVKTSLGPAGEAALPPALKEWVSHQKGLRSIGLLAAHRVSLLSRVGISWEPLRSPEDDIWDEKLTEILKFKAENGTLDAMVVKSFNPELYEVLSALGELPRAKAAQLQSIGVDIRKFSSQSGSVSSDPVVSLA